MSAVTPLEELGRPLYHPVEETAGLEAPPGRLDEAHRTRVRSLSEMQKEALVSSHHTGRTWRLASDEGPYLDGADVAPAPLAYMTAGMVSSYADAVLALADRRDIDLADLTLVQDNFYTMRGSALRGDMTGGALDPTVEARVAADADEAILEALVRDAVAAAPVTGLLDGVHESRFALTYNGEPLEPDRVHALDAPRLDDPTPDFDALPRTAEPLDPPVVNHTGRTTEEFEGDRERYTSGEGSSLAEEQDRVLHLRGTCTVRDDGRYHIEQKLYSPIGSVFEFLAAGTDGSDQAPDPLTYVAAGLGFCFMTQFGRYADIVEKDIDDYRIIQDTHLAAGDPEAGTPPAAEPVECHVFIDSPEDAAFGRTVLDMSEQTCFLHALCRTDLAPSIDVSVR